MKKFKELKFNRDILYLLILFIIFIVLIYFFGSYLHYEISDIGREIYISSEIANGKVLYKDLFNIFAPMSYYFNAFAIKVFGDYFQTFISIGAILSLFSIFPLYKITKQFLKSEIAFTTILLIFFTCIFISAVTNWITPYTYSMVYAMTFVIWSLYFLLKYLDFSENKYLYYSAFLYGLSISCKYDFFLFIIPILICLIYKRAEIKIYFKATLLMTIMPIVAIIICFINGNTIESLHTAMKYIIETVKSPHLNYYYKWTGIEPSPIIFNNLEWTLPQYIGFFWLGYSSVITLIIYILKKQSFKYIFLNICVIILSLKSIFFVNLSNYGSFSFPFLYINLLCFLYSIFKDSSICKKIVLFLIIITNLVFTFIYINFKYYDVIEFGKIDTNKGIIHTNKNSFYNNHQELIKFINNNLEENDKILIIPEGVIYNYITDKESDGYLFYMIPNNLDVFDYDYCVNRLRERDFEYIVVTSFWYGNYGEEYFKSSFGKEIFNNYILKEYDLKDIIINDYTNKYDMTEYLIFKKKSDLSNE